MVTINPEQGSTDKVQEVTKPTVIKSSDEDLNKEYIDKRNITISTVHNYSNYRKANMKVLGQRKETIGSSIKSCRVLSSNEGEVNKYFPAIVGLSSNNPEFVSRVKAWLSNIKFVVSENNVTFDISFIYNRKADFIAFKKREEAIEEEFEKADRSNIVKLKEAVDRKVDAINALESEKYKYGKPVNLEQYLMYRHCLLYRDVAKDIALINSDPNLRFYIKDDAKEAEKQKKFTQERVNAMRNFIELSGTQEKYNSVYIAIALYRNDNLHNALLKSSDEKNAIVMNFVNEHPDKFNKFVKDNNIILKAFIETLIIRGELIRAEFNQQISSADGNFIGSNMNEAIAYFKNPANKEIYEGYLNKLKMF